MGRPLVRAVVCIAVVLAAAMPLARAQGPAYDYVAFTTGGAVTSGYGPGLRLGLKPPELYSKQSYAGVSGRWTGPQYFSFPVADHNGTASMNWRVAFSRASTPTAATMSQLTHGWPVAEQDRVDNDQWIGEKVVNERPGTVTLTKNPEPNSAQYETAVAVPLCRGVYAIAVFESLDPPSDAAPPPNIRYYVGGDGSIVPSTWAHDATLAAAQEVIVVGALPIGRVVAKARRRVISGRVVDCAGGAEAHAKVKVGRRTLKADLNGAFRARVAVPGRYRISASVAGRTKSIWLRVR